MDYSYRNDQPKDKQFLCDYGYVKCSSYRRRVLNTLFLGQSVQTPTEIAKNSEIRVNHISKTLSELKNRGIVECMNEEMRKGRMYRLTQLGRDIVLFFVDNDGEVWND